MVHIADDRIEFDRSGAVRNCLIEFILVEVCMAATAIDDSH